MAETLDRIRLLVKLGDWSASRHALQRLAEHGVIASDLVDRIAEAESIEAYPDYHAGPCILTLQADRDGPVHALWGLQKGTDRPAVLITVYRPDAERWHSDNRTRKS